MDSRRRKEATLARPLCSVLTPMPMTAVGSRILQMEKLRPREVK